jgi:signal transduction histidine kinase
MRINFKPIDWDLRPKIILHVFVIGLIAAIILSYVSFSTQKNITNTMRKQKLEIVGAMIESSISLHMEEGKEKDIELTLQKLAASTSIEEIRILDLDGKILISSDHDEIGTEIDENEKSILNNLLKDDGRDEFVFVRSPTPTTSFMTIKNRKECMRCHSADHKINAILEIAIDDTATSKLIHQNRLQGIVIAFVSLVILTYIIYRLFERIINRPLSVLKVHMKKVQDGNLSAQLNPQKNDEIGALTTSFNIMISNLKTARDQIEELHSREIERAGHLASMGELAAGLAHEIKNPIAGIKGALEVIIQRTEASDPKKEIFTEILSQIDRIHNIVQDLLDYARPKAMTFKPVNPNDYIQNAIKLAQSQTQDKDIQIKFKGFDNDIRVNCDENKIQEVILNLLINSISAIEKKGEISIILEKINNKNIDIVIEDNGKGIKKEHLSHVFDPFFTTRKKGTGLGLSICKRIIDAHRGSIEVNSVEGKKTVFAIRLPLYRQKKNQ